MAADTPFREAEDAKASSKRLIQSIKDTAASSSDAYRAARMSFADRAATVQSGQNILFLDPDCSLQNPHVAGPAGVNHPGRRAKFTWDAHAVDNLLRIVAHTNARIVLTSKWRNRATMRTNFNRELQARGLPVTIGRLGVLEDTGGGRAAEVLHFLDEYSRGQSTTGAKVHGWCALDERNFGAPDPDYEFGRFHGHFVQTDKKFGISDAVADRCIECIRMRKLDAPKRTFKVPGFVHAPGLQYAVDAETLRPEKSSIYDAEESSSDSDDSDDDETGATSD
jgi:hypothetical protein